MVIEGFAGELETQMKLRLRRSRPGTIGRFGRDVSAIPMQIFEWVERIRRELPPRVDYADGNLIEARGGSAHALKFGVRECPNSS